MGGDSLEEGKLTVHSCILFGVVALVVLDGGRNIPSHCFSELIPASPCLGLGCESPPVVLVLGSLSPWTYILCFVSPKHVFSFNFLPPNSTMFTFCLLQLQMISKLSVGPSPKHECPTHGCPLHIKAFPFYTSGIFLSVHWGCSVGLTS